MPDNKGFSPQKRWEMKSRIQELLEIGDLTEAEALLVSYARAQPDDHDIYLLKGVLFIMTGEKQRAMEVMEEGLEKKPGHYNLLFNLGYLMEVNGDILSAFNAFRQAEYAVRTAAQANDLKERIKHIKKNIQSQISIGERDYYIQVTAGRKSYRIEYPLEELLVRKKILHLILQYRHPEAETLLEIQCGPGIISRTLSLVGLKTTGIDAQNKEILRALVFEMQGQVREREKIAMTKLYHAPVSTGYLEEMDSYDITVLSPFSIDWYNQYRPYAALNIIRSLCRKTARQCFIYLPAAQEEGQRVTDDIKDSLLQMDWGLDSSINSIGGGEIPGHLFEIKKGKVRRLERAIPAGMESLQHHSHLMEVELEKCRDIQYFSYTPQGWHPFTAAIEEYLEDPSITYENSILKVFYERFQPKNRQQQLLEEEKDELKPLCQGWPNLPWQKGPRGIPKKFITERMLEIGGNQHFGPNTDAFGEKLFQRLINTYQLLQMHGYHPEIFPDGYIMGYLLVTDHEYRFVITEGQHRISALALLGTKRLLCQLIKDDQNPPFIQERECKEWMQVKNELYSQEVAEKLFMKFFHEDGREKAERLGIIE